MGKESKQTSLSRLKADRLAEIFDSGQEEAVVKELLRRMKQTAMAMKERERAARG